MKTAKIGAIFLVSVMAFAAIGASLAHWEETIYVKGDIMTDNIDVYFDWRCTFTNDPFEGEWGQIADADGCGEWVFVKGEGYQWRGERRGKNVGYCDVFPGNDDNELTIEIRDAYPCYYAHPLFCIKNRGSCPVQVYGVQLLEVSEGKRKIAVDPPMTLVPCHVYYIEVFKDENKEWTYRIVRDDDDPKPDPDEFDFSLHLTGDQWAQGTQLDPDYWSGGDEPPHVPCGQEIVYAIYGDLCIHMENSCEQLQHYDFKIGITFFNWPELPEPIQD
jgi:hypothetical protein